MLPQTNVTGRIGKVLGSKNGVNSPFVITLILKDSYTNKAGERKEVTESWIVRFFPRSQQALDMMNNVFYVGNLIQIKGVCRTGAHQDEKGNWVQSPYIEANAFETLDQRNPKFNNREFQASTAAGGTTNNRGSSNVVNNPNVPMDDYNENLPF